MDILICCFWYILICHFLYIVTSRLQVSVRLVGRIRLGVSLSFSHAPNLRTQLQPEKTGLVGRIHYLRIDINF
jgi:hypothetical protein